MKASELRIGNFINDFGDGVGQVTSIHSYDGEDDVQTTANSLALPISNYKPIPLTEEWLIKFGCKKLGPSWWETPNGVQFNFSDGNKCGLITFGSRHVNFWHVHTLQNIISLTGEELELKPSSPTS